MLEYTRTLIANGFSKVQDKLEIEINNARNKLRDLEIKSFIHYKETEESLKELGILPITITCASGSFRLYALTQQANNYIKQYNLNDAGVVYDLLFSIASYSGMFILIKLTAEYNEFYKIEEKEEEKEE